MDVFKRIDKDGNGELDVDEFRQAFQIMGLDLPRTQVTARHRSLPDQRERDRETETETEIETETETETETNGQIDRQTNGRTDGQTEAKAEAEAETETETERKTERKKGKTHLFQTSTRRSFCRGQNPLASEKELRNYEMSTALQCVAGDGPASPV